MKQEFLRRWEALKPVAFIMVTGFIILLIEGGRLSGVIIPIPFLLLYAGIVAAAGMAGMLAGGISGALGAAYVVYAAINGFGPETLTGDVSHVLLGASLYIGTGLLIGRVQDQQNACRQEILESEAKLQTRIEEARSRESRKSASLKAVVDTMEQGVMAYDGDDKAIFFNARFVALFDLPPGFLREDMSLGEVIRYRAARGDYGEGEVEEIVRRRLDDRRMHGPSRRGEFLAPNGALCTRYRRPLPGGGSIVTYSDITERKLHQDYLDGIMNNVADGIITITTKGEIETFNHAAESIFGYSAAQACGQNVKMLMPAPVGSAHDGYLEAYNKTGVGHIIGIGPREVTARHRDGSTFPMSLAISVMEVAGEKKFIGITRDITQQKDTEHQLQQALKMDAIGQLTGGIAHDFNNLLTAIIGNLELLKEKTGGDEGMERNIGTVLAAAFRGADLTKRLLAFSRKETLSPELTNLNVLIPNTVQLLGRTLGADIGIETVLAGGLWWTMIDQSLLENALLNLAVNARDAMPDGGKLTIETANTRLDEAYAAAHNEVAPGQYVMVAVSDTGIGMSNETRVRVFEPFFTTKDVGKGTGLGLSMVFGFVKQSGGHIDVYSEEGQGATVKLYFPKTTAPDRAHEAGHHESAPMPMGAETILVVEDDPDVRAFVVAALKLMGYTVLEAEGGPAALRVLDAGAAIDLLMTDVVMPGGMSGRDVANEAEKRYPHIKVLFTTGYTENAIVHHGRLDEDVDVLGKPYNRQALARKVRDILDKRVD